MIDASIIAGAFSCALRKYIADYEVWVEKIYNAEVEMCIRDRPGASTSPA